MRRFATAKDISTIARMLADGKTYRAIGRQIGRSESSVRHLAHRHKLREPRPQPRDDYRFVPTGDDDTLVRLCMEQGGFPVLDAERGRAALADAQERRAA